MWDWGRSHRNSSNHQEGLHPTKGHHPPGPCYRQHPRRHPTVRKGSVLDHPLPLVRRVWVYLHHHPHHDLRNNSGSRRVVQHHHRNPLEPQGWVYPLQSLHSLHPLHRLQRLPRRPTVRRKRRRRRRTSSSGTTRGSTTSSAHSRVARIRNTPTTRRRVQSLQRSADHAVRERKIAAVTETRTVTTNYKGNNHPPRVTRVSTRQTSP